MEAPLFVAPIIERVCKSDHGYMNKWKLDDMKNTMIPLPQDAHGNPDWEYMDDYMSEVMRESGSVLGAFAHVGGRR